MTRGAIFDKENAVLDAADGVLDATDGAHVPRQEYADLLAGYRKLLKQTRRLIKVSDRQQLELVELNALKNKFLGMAAHDLRNPCAAINGFSELLISIPDMTPEEHQEYAEIIHQASENMMRLLGDLLDVSAIESGKLSMTPSEGDLAALVAERVSLMHMLAAKKNIRINYDAPTLPPLTFDADRLGQVIDNLISNAIKFSEADTEVTVSLEIDDGAVELKVRDQGPGIPDADLERLFGTFEKLSNRPTGGEKSSGLGLAIVKKIVTGHGGSITVDSEIGEGSVFRVTIPR